MLIIKWGVLDKNGVFIKHSLTFWFGGPYELKDDQKIINDSRTVVFLGEYDKDTWGHVFVNLLVRFWYCYLNYDNIDAYIIIDKNPGQEHNHKPLNDLIKLAGLEDKIIYVNSPTRFKKVIVPEPSFTSTYYSDHYWKTIDIIKQNALKQDCKIDNYPNKIFLSRSHFKKALTLEGGLELLDNYFKNNDFTIIYPEEHSIVEMINIMNEAKLCACESGSIAFNGLFGNNDLHLIVIDRLPVFPKGNLITNLSRIKKITYIDGNYSIYTTSVGGVCMLGFTDELEKFTLDNSYHYPDSVF